MKARWLSITIATLLLLGIPTPGVGAQGATPDGTRALHPNFTGSPNYWQVKATLDAQAATAQAAPAEAVSSAAPVASPNWKGQSAFAFGYSPSDATGAIGPDRYIELVNSSIGVYSRTGALLSQASQSRWTGYIQASGDAEVMWDNNQGRFFYSMLYIGADKELLFGFSKGSTPSALPTDWCSYNSTFGTYGSDFPDYPKLGITNDFMLIGVNRFDSAGTIYKGSDVAVSRSPRPARSWFVRRLAASCKVSRSASRMPTRPTPTPRSRGTTPTRSERASSSPRTTSAAAARPAP